MNSNIVYFYQKINKSEISPHIRRVIVISLLQLTASNSSAIFQNTTNTLSSNQEPPDNSLPYSQQHDTGPCPKQGSSCVTWEMETMTSVSISVIMQYEHIIGD
jgi:hypothetical protein